MKGCEDFELREEIASLEELLATAERSGNAAALHHLVAPDFGGVDPGGRRIDRAAFIKAFTSPDLHIQSVRLERVTVHTFDKVAVAVGTVTRQGVASGRPINGQYHFTNVWVRRLMHWELMVAHLSTAPH